MIIKRLTDKLTHFEETPQTLKVSALNYPCFHISNIW